jgi:hypothetical protein
VNVSGHDNDDAIRTTLNKSGEHYVIYPIRMDGAISERKIRDFLGELGNRIQNLLHISDLHDEREGFALLRITFRERDRKKKHGRTRSS